MIRAAVTVLVLMFAATCGSTQERLMRPTGLEVMQVALDQSAPIIRDFRLATGEKLLGAVGDVRPTVYFYAASEEKIKYRDSTEADARTEYDCKFTTGSAVYTSKLFWKEKLAAGFTVMFALSGNQVNVTCQVTSESAGFQLLAIEMPPFVSVDADKNGKLVIPTYGGRLIDVGGSRDYEALINDLRHNPIRTAMAISDEAMGMVSVNSLDDGLAAKVSGSSPRLGTLSVKFVRRYEASEPRYQFALPAASTCTITVLGKKGKNPPEWTDGAEYIRDGLRAKINPLYSKALVYKIRCSSPEDEELITFADCLKMIKEVHGLIGDAQQIVYLSGWQNRAWSTEDPDAPKVDERLGGVEGLKDLISKAKESNATVSLVDNFGLAIKDKLNWNEAYIARDGAGELKKSNAEDDCYVFSSYRYAFGPAVERIREMTADFGVKETVYVESLSTPGLCDFNPDNPVGAQKDLEAKLKLAEQFRRAGIDVSTGEFAMAFAGKVGYFSSFGCTDDAVFSDEEIIPLVPFIAHSKITAGSEAGTDTELLRALLYGLKSSETITKPDSTERLTDVFYLIDLPALKLSGKEMTGFRRSGDTERVDYGPESYVEIDRKKETYKVVVDGSTVGENFTATVPMDNRTILVYSRDGGDVSFTIPKAWDLRQARLYSLNPDGSRTLEALSVEQRTVTVEAKGHVPYVVRTED